MIKAASGFFVVVALAVALLAPKVKGLEKTKTTEVIKAPLPSSLYNVLSAPDALEWRQEFLWQRKILHICANAWIDEQPCGRIAERL